MQVNTNDIQTGLGNGVYYMDIGKKVRQPHTGELRLKNVRQIGQEEDSDGNDGMYKALTDEEDSDGNKVKMENFASHKYGTSLHSK